MDTPYEFIRQKIIQAFLNLAEREGEQAASPDDVDGLPMALFKAENVLLSAWEAYCENP